MPRILAALLVLAFAMPAAAQETGGLQLAPGIGKGPTGLARRLPVVQPAFTAGDVQSALVGSSDDTAQNQAMVAQVRGDGGFLGGFSMGTPLSASVQRGGGIGFFDPGNGHLIVVNKTIDNSFSTFNAPVAITRGNGNSVQLQSANGSGPIALQQVANGPGVHTGGAVNTALGAGPAVRTGGASNTALGGPAVRTAVPVAPIGGAGMQTGGFAAPRGLQEGGIRLQRGHRRP